MQKETQHDREIKRVAKLLLLIWHDGTPAAERENAKARLAVWRKEWGEVEYRQTQHAAIALLIKQA